MFSKPISTVEAWSLIYNRGVGLPAYKHYEDPEVASIAKELAEILARENELLKRLHKLAEEAGWKASDYTVEY